MYSCLFAWGYNNDICNVMHRSHYCTACLFAWGYNNAASDIDSRLPPTLEVISWSMTSCIKDKTRCIKKVLKKANAIKMT